MVSLATDENDRTTAEAYRAFVQTHSLRMYGMRSGVVESEGEVFDNLADVAWELCFTTAQPVIGEPAEADLGDGRKAWSLPVRNWSLRNGYPQALTIHGLVVADLTTERILYLHWFDEPLSVASFASVAFDLEFRFDTIRSVSG